MTAGGAGYQYFMISITVTTLFLHQIAWSSLSMCKSPTMQNLKQHSALDLHLRNN